MKRIRMMFLAVCALVLIACCGCGDEGTGTSKESVDLDLTKMSGTAVYSEVFNMVTTPDDYEGKCVKITGQFYHGEDKNTGEIFYYCVIPDAAGCCQQGIEFVPGEKCEYPADFPEEGKDITVTGIFEQYDYEDSNGTVKLCRLADADMEAGGSQ